MAVFKSSPVSTGLERAGRQQGGRGQETQSTERPRSSLVRRIKITGFGRTGYALVHGRHTNVEPRTNDRNFCDYMLVTAFMSDKYLIGIRGQVQYIFYNPSGGWHCGQSNLSQVTESFRWLSKCSFSFCLNSSLFRINLIFSFFKFCHTLGK